MNKYFKIDGKLTEEVEDNLLETLNNLEENNNLILWICSSGGNIDVADNIIDLIQNDDRIIKVKFYWQVSSCAFRIMDSTPKYKRVILNDVWSTLHLYSRDSDYRNMLKKDSKTEFLYNNMLKQNEILLQHFRDIGVSEEHLDLIRKGEDVNLTYDDIMNLNI